jgi:hypothetical protein
MDVAAKTRLLVKAAQGSGPARPAGGWGKRLWTALQMPAWPDQLWPLIKILRLPILFTMATFLIFGLGQSKSVLEALSKAGRLGAYGSLLAATLMWAAAMWYSCRVLLYFHRKSLPFKPHESFLANWLPRLLGGATFEAVGGWHPWTVATSLAFMFATVARRKLLDMRHQPQSRDDDHSVKGFARYFFGICCAVFLILSVLFATPLGIGVARWMGAGAIVCLGLACLTALLAGISILKFPLIPFEIALLAWLAFASWRNDNHVLRILDKPLSNEAGIETAKPTLQAYFRQWCGMNLPAAGNGNAGAAPDTFPVFVVAAEGGGIKAAYWTAAILSRLQDRNPAFGRHLFMVSGVSGGSLGAAAFTALLSERAEGAGAGNAASASFEARADALLSQDHLSPILSRFFFTDCLARFLPWAVPAFDRGRAMETSWEQTWRSLRGDDRFAERFHGLWADSSRALPVLLLNGTHVESGKRVIASNVGLDGVFTDAIDLDSVAGPHFPLSAAASMSARFPFVTPSALIRGPHGKWGHVVDGGYYENSGAATAFEALQALRPVMDSVGALAGIQIVPYTLIIRDDPPDSVGLSNFLNDLTDPFMAAYDTRAGRTAFSLAQLRAAGRGRLIECNLSDPLVPLGWFLSWKGVDRIRKSLDAMDADQFAKIESLLSSREASRAPSR